jgi:hypothetical protein
MRSHIILVFAFVFTILAINYSGASAVLTLTGTCRAPLLNYTNHTIYFYLSGKGNATATNLQLVPHLTGLNASPISEVIPSFSPGENVSFSFNVSNFSVPGSYAGGFILEYLQYGTVFVTAFPCEYSIMKPTQSLLSIINVNTSNNHISASILNLEGKAVNTSISLIIPPLISTSPSSIDVMLNPNSKYDAIFDIATQQSYKNGTSIPIGVVVSYAEGGLHYATVATTYLTFASHPSINLLEYGIIGVFAIVVVIILILIIFAVMKGKREKNKNPAHTKVNA